MPHVTISREQFLEDRQGRTFADVVNDPDEPFAPLLAFFDDADRQQRMEDAELHHERPPLAGVVRELEAQPEVDKFLASQHPRRTKRLRQAIGVLVRMIMEARGWRTTGRKGSLGVRSSAATAGNEAPGSYHNTGGLAFWFVRAERYERVEGMPYQSVRERCRQIESQNKPDSAPPSRAKRPGSAQKKRSNRVLK